MRRYASRWRNDDFGVSRPFVEASQIEVGIGELRIESQRFTVRDDGLRLAAQILEQHGEIEYQKRLRLTAESIDLFRFGQAAVQMQQPA